MNKNEMSRNETGAHLPPFPELHGTSTETEALSSPVEFGILGTEEPMTASHASLLQLSASETSLKHLKSLSQASLSTPAGQSSAFVKSEDLPAPPTYSDTAGEGVGEGEASVAKPHPTVKRENVNVSPEPHNKNDQHVVVSHDEATSTTADSSSNLSESAPLKATTFRHLNQKYLAELEYMLCEFQKLERQLLGARNLQANESDGSRERREKLHSFILHLEDTIRQINSGCESEAAVKTTAEGKKKTAELAKPLNEKTEQENVHKLEEHILANLLPVKVRLKKQLAAQQGAKHNPAGMPVRGVVSDRAATSSKEGDAAFSASSGGPSQFGKPLAGGGSTLTQKLHGRTLGTEGRAHGHGVGSSTVDKAGTETKQILYAGMAIGSDRSQMRSSLSAASSAHRLLLQGKDVTDKSRKRMREEIDKSVGKTTISLINKNAEACTDTLATDDLLRTDASVSHGNKTIDDVDSVSSLLSAERKRMQRKKRHKRKRMLKEQHLQDSQQQATVGAMKRKKGTGSSKKRGPRNVEYMCALCNEVYNSTCDYNPWWALSQEECPKCRKTQIPRIDIGAPANAIEYHPALLAHADESAGAAEPSAAPTSQGSIVKAPIPSTSGDCMDYSDVDDSDLSDEDGLLSEDSLDLDSDESEAAGTENMSPAEQAELEKFGAEYDGPKFSDSEAARLLNLMLHASSCPCRHKSSDHYEVCRSAKWMMLHVRDCPGTTSTFDVCPFPWCRKTKHLLYHLVSCDNPATCQICSPVNLNTNMKALRGLSYYRLKKQRQCLLVANQKQPSGKGKSPVTKERQQLLRNPQSSGNASNIVDHDEFEEAITCEVPPKDFVVDKDAKDSLESSSSAHTTSVIGPFEQAGLNTDCPNTETIDQGMYTHSFEFKQHRVNKAESDDPSGNTPTVETERASVVKEDSVSPKVESSTTEMSGQTCDGVLVKEEQA